VGRDAADTIMPVMPRGWHRYSGAELLRVPCVSRFSRP